MEIDWIEQDPKKNFPRYKYEVALLNEKFPKFKFFVMGNVLFVEGKLITRSDNIYLVRAYYPNSYPYKAPEPVVIDRDVASFCTSAGMHKMHNWGEHEYGGLKLCVLKPDDTVGEGWKMNYSIVTIVNYIATWLHAYEYKKETGIWLLPEA
jgi:hypothetical protein